jgi:hypothetical protein
MEPKGSLPCSQQPDTGPYSEPDESSPHSPTLFPQDSFNIILSSAPISSEWSLHASQPQFCEHFPSPHACYMSSPSHHPWFHIQSQNFTSITDQFFQPMTFVTTWKQNKGFGNREINNQEKWTMPIFAICTAAESYKTQKTAERAIIMLDAIIWTEDLSKET